MPALGSREPIKSHAMRLPFLMFGQDQWGINGAGLLLLTSARVAAVRGGRVLGNLRIGNPTQRVGLKGGVHPGAPGRREIESNQRFT
jgi:hypothetical protein